MGVNGSASTRACVRVPEMEPLIFFYTSKSPIFKESKRFYNKTGIFFVFSEQQLPTPTNMKRIQLSETKLNQLANEISDRLFESHYFTQDTISGDVLNSFCDHEQVNKFLLFQVYQVWQLQMSRFKHPFFNFDNTEVKELLVQLQNLLSRNIAIKKEDFKPLLFKAVLNNLRLLTDPKEALQQFFFQNKEKIGIDMYERYVPFFSDFDFVINSILKYYQKNEIKQVEKDVFLLKFDRVLDVYNQKSEQDADTYRNLRFYKLTGRRLDEVVKEDEAETAERNLKQKEEEAQKKIEALKKQEEEREKQEAIHKAEAAAKRAEEEAKKRNALSFFDEIPAHQDHVFDLGDDNSSASSTTAPTTASHLANSESVETVKDQIKEEEPVWKRLKDQTETTPTQADRLSEVGQHKQEDTLMQKLAQNDQTNTPTTTIAPAPQEKKETSTIFNRVAEEKENKPQADKEPSTVFEKAAEEKENKESTASSVLETATQADNKPTSLVDLLKSKTSGNGEEEKKETNPEPAKPEASPTSAPVVDVVEPKLEQTKSPVSEPTQPETPNVQPETPKTVAASIEEKPASLLDRFRQQTQESQAEPAAPKEQTLADKFKANIPKTPIGANIDAAPSPANKTVKADDIPIHKQYRFVQKVFGGNNVRFRIIVDKINNAKTTQQVEEILNKYVFSNTDLNRDDETVKEFVKLMRGEA